MMKIGRSYPFELRTNYFIRTITLTVLCFEEQEIQEFFKLKKNNET